MRKTLYWIRKKWVKVKYIKSEIKEKQLQPRSQNKEEHKRLLGTITGTKIPGQFGRNG